MQRVLRISVLFGGSSRCRHFVGYFPSDSGHQVFPRWKNSLSDPILLRQKSYPCLVSDIWDFNRLLMSQAMYNMNQRQKLPFALEPMPQCPWLFCELSLHLWFIRTMQSWKALLVRQFKKQKLEEFNQNLIPRSVASKSMVHQYTIQYGNLDYIPLGNFRQKLCL